MQTTLSVESKCWAETGRMHTPASLSLVMLFADLERWQAFSLLRFKEMRRSGIFTEVVFVINREDEHVVEAVTADLHRYFDDFPTLILFHRDNNIPAGRNVGVAHARGKSVLIWDDDDSADPKALANAYKRIFVPGKFPILELPLAHVDGSPFHPQADDMPQEPFPGRKNLLIMGMVHTPYFARKWVLTKFPIPEHVALRGDWLHWSALLWRNGIPIICLQGQVARETDRCRDAGATASIRVNDFARFHAFVSLLFLFWQYDIGAKTAECAVIRRRYFNRYCVTNQDKRWGMLLRFAEALRNRSKIRNIKALRKEGRYNRILTDAYSHVSEVVEKMQRCGKNPMKGGSPPFEVMPFEMLSPAREKELRKTLRGLKVA